MATDDRLELVRFELTEIAANHFLRCIVRVLATAATPDTWRDIALDLDDAATAQRTKTPPAWANLSVAAFAAEHVAAEDLDGAVYALGGAAMQTPEAWCTETRALLAASKAVA